MNQLRKKGATTRLVDAAVQELFTVGYCLIQDHSNHKQGDQYLSHCIEQRMYHEHQIRIKVELGKAGLFAYIEPNNTEIVTPIKTPSIFRRFGTSWNYIVNGK